MDAREFFADLKPEIAKAPNMTSRNKKIKALKKEEPTLYEEFENASRFVDGFKHFVHNAGRFPLTSFGRLNLAPLFAELSRHVLSTSGKVGIIVPTGIATDSFNQYFFQDLVEQGSLVSLFSFENEEMVFPDIHHATKFCLLTLAGHEMPCESSDFVFFARQVVDLKDEHRHFTLSAADISLLNPNTRTCPIFRSKRDAKLTKQIFRRVPILLREGPPEENPWGIKFMLMFITTTRL
jgi:hypothetical protein